MLSLKNCIENGTHLRNCDDDGFCNFCGHQDQPLFKQKEDHIESITIKLQPEKQPKLFNYKVEELMSQGIDYEDAKNMVLEMEFEMEVYYSPDRGLFLVDTEAVESSYIFDPYTGIQLME